MLLDDVGKRVGVRDLRLVLAKSAEFLYIACAWMCKADDDE
jgi:hypothetical protein